MQITIPPRVQLISNAIINAHGMPYIVGGFVRDAVMRQLGRSVPQSKDVDIEVFDIGINDLRNAIAPLGRLNEVGMSFGVIKLTFADGEQFDISLPRRENKEGQGHRGFIVEANSSMTLAEAAARRDFTMNALFANPHGFVIDLFDGIADIRGWVLRATSDAFMEDPLRVLRAMQFASRFGMTLSQETIEMSQSIVDQFSTLSGERVWIEFSKWSRSPIPERGLAVLLDTWWIENFPELNALRLTQQSPDWHPEGSTMAHTLLSVASTAAFTTLSDDDRETLVLATLLHDIGKPLTTTIIKNRITSHGHAEVGAVMARAFLNRMRAPDAVVDRVSTLVREHMTHVSGELTPSAVRRLALRLERGGTDIRMLAMLATADASGRTTGWHEPMAEWVAMAKSMTLSHNGPARILLGRHLIAEGVTPGPHFGPILNKAFEAQLNGEFSDESGALNWFRTNHAN